MAHLGNMERMAKIAWRLNANGKPSILQGQNARDYMRHYRTLHESLEWTKQFGAILYAGKKTIDDEPVHHLIFVATDNRQINRYFSAKTGLFVREEKIIGTEENTQILISEIRDYVREEKRLSCIPQSTQSFWIGLFHRVQNYIS